MSETVQRGSICAEVDDSGNVRLYMSHTPSNGMRVERADVDDLVIVVQRARDAQSRIKMKQLSEENQRLIQRLRDERSKK